MNAQQMSNTPALKLGSMPICEGCVFRDAGRCECPQSKAHGGPGIFLRQESCTGRELAWNEALFEPGRFPGCPVICLQANLPAFGNREEALRWHDQTGGDRCKLTKKPWLCASCNSWHYLSRAPAPAGGSSGTERK